MTADVSAVLTRAAELIEERGWTQGEYEDESGCLCLAGAIDVAAGDSLHLGRDAAWRARVALWPIIGVNTIAWNDDERRQQSEVVAALRAAAAEAAS